MNAAVFEAKIVPPAELSQRVASLPHPLVFTNGCFDILHRGHVTYLAQARSLGASLIVAVNTDASVKRLGKGEERPINTLDDVLVDDQFHAAGGVVYVPDGDDSVPMVASPADFSGTPAQPRCPAPQLGEHTEEVLAQLRRNPGA